MKFRGSGLSEVRDQKCTACQVMLRPQTYNEVRAGQSVIECESCQRILYFNPENEATIERTNFTAERRARPKVDSQQAWFYQPSFGEIGEAFLAFVNSATTSARRRCTSCTPAARSVTPSTAKAASAWLSPKI